RPAHGTRPPWHVIFFGAATLACRKGKSDVLHNGSPAAWVVAVPSPRKPSPLDRSAGADAVGPPPMPEMDDAVEALRALARTGRLAERARRATPAEHRRLSGAALAVVWPVVFHRLTRVYEQRRGHRACARSVDQLTDACLDRFYDDLEAVAADLLAHA